MASLEIGKHTDVEDFLLLARSCRPMRSRPRLLLRVDRTYHRVASTAGLTRQLVLGWLLFFRAKDIDQCQHQRQTPVEQSFGTAPWATHGLRSKP
jgi:hypothetical protein